MGNCNSCTSRNNPAFDPAPETLDPVLPASGQRRSSASHVEHNLPRRASSGSASRVRTPVSPPTIGKSESAGRSSKLPLLPELLAVAAELPYAIAGASKDRVQIFRPNEVPLEPLLVKPSTLRHLKRAQHVIDKYVNDDSMRMGNQISDIIASKGESWARLSKLVGWYDKHYGTTPLDPRIKAEAALHFKGFNCINIGSVALVELIASGLDAPIVHIQGPNHSCVLIGDPADPRNREEDIVVVDLWARFPMAHTMKTARFKCPLKSLDETDDDYLNRCASSDWSRAKVWNPHQRDYLAGFDFSSTPKTWNHDGIPFADPSSTADSDSAEFLVEDDLDDCAFDVTTHTPESRPAPEPFDASAYIEQVCGPDPLPAIFSRSVDVEGHVVSEWLFSTAQAGIGYISQDQSEPVTFNEFPKDCWEQWQQAIVECRSRDFLSMMPPDKAQWVDLPKAT